MATLIDSLTFFTLSTDVSLGMEKLLSRLVVDLFEDRSFIIRYYSLSSQSHMRSHMRNYGSGKECAETTRSSLQYSAIVQDTIRPRLHDNVSA